MEKETELKKLVNVLRRTARMAMQSEWTGGGQQDAASYCAEQYNRVLARLNELDETVSKVFSPLPEGSSLTVTAMACRQLSAYYEEELGRHHWDFSRAKSYGFGYNAEAFKEFWRNSAHEFEDLGEFIRESIEEWFRTKKGDKKEEKSTNEKKRD